MSKHSLINLKEIFPGTIDDLFVPWSGWFHKSSTGNLNSIPALNIYDEKEHYKVTVAAPGLDKGDFDIGIDNNVLTISAVSEKEKEEDKRRYHRKEYSYTSFSRSFTLPSNVNHDAVEATYDKGILTLVLPKNSKDKNADEKKISIK